MPKTEMTLKIAVDGFRFRNETTNKSPRTIETYDRYLKQAAEFFVTRHQGATVDTLALAAITTEDCQQLVAHLQARSVLFENMPNRQPVKRHLSPYTIHGYLRSLSSFFNWAVASKYLRKSPLAGQEKPKLPKGIKPIFSKEDIIAILKVCSEYPEQLAARDRALVLFLLSTGVRAAELCSLTMDRLDPSLRRAHITGKGTKDRYIVIGARAREALWKYINVYRPQPRFDVNAVFLTQRGDPIRPDELAHILARMGERAGVKGCRPHRFRHTFATEFYRGGGDVLTLQALLGHESLETTRVYTKIGDEDLERIAERVNPADRWGL